MKKNILSLIGLLFFYCAFAQDSVSISGRILDKNTRLPISYTSISMETLNHGSMSNEDGEYRLRLPIVKEGSRVRVSRIGYATYNTSLSDLIAAKGLIELVPRFDSLSEVVVRPPNALELVKGAFDKIKANYSQQPLRMTGFYREYDLENEQTVELSEALLGVYFSPYGRGESEVQLKLLKGRKSKDSAASQVEKYAHFGGIPHSLLQTDVAHSTQEFDSREFLKNTEMKLVNTWSLDNDFVYEIKFDQKDNIKKPLYKGKIFIDSKSLAIVSLDFTISPKGIVHYKLLKGASKAMASMYGMDMDLIDQHVVINYKKIDTTWYLNDVVGTYQYHFTKTKGKREPEALDIKIILGCEFLVTEIDRMDAMPFKKSEELEYKGPFAKKIKDYDPAFWEGDNYIVPSKKIRNIAEKLKRL